MLGRILMSPLSGLVFVARKIDEAAQQEQDREKTEIMNRLQALHAALEAGDMTEAEFEEEEEQLLDRLDRLAADE
jgi:Gas vesicle protein G.